MKKVRWIIQTNLSEIEKMTSACEKLGIEYEGVYVIPFSNEMPEFTKDIDTTNIYYGSTTFMYNVYRQLNKPVGLFFEEKTFSMEKYLDVWNYYMLSSDGKITTLKKFIQEEHPDDMNFFIRPDADDKSFDGVVKPFSEIKTFINNITKCDNAMLNEDTKILVSEPYNITKEWRNYIVNGKVVTSTLYRKNFKLCKDGTDAPAEMIEFVEERCKEYMPHEVFTMDIALSGDDYYIIECGCMNSVGFYDCNVEKLVSEITKYVSGNE